MGKQKVVEDPTITKLALDMLTLLEEFESLFRES